MSTVLRIGVVGGGLIAQAIHLPRIARLGERFELVAIVDPSETVREALCARYPSARPYGDWRSMLEAEVVDAIVICSPHATHAEITLGALDAGVHVLVEKPLCIDPVDAHAICRRRDETGLVVQVGYMKRFDAGYASLLEHLPPGRTDVRMIDVVTYDPSRIVSAEGVRHTSEVHQRIADSYLTQLKHFHACIIDRSTCRNPSEDATMDIEVLRDLFLAHSQADRRPSLVAGRSS